jgi:hypothetical protein
MDGILKPSNQPEQDLDGLHIYAEWLPGGTIRFGACWIDGLCNIYDEGEPRMFILQKSSCPG